MENKIEISSKTPDDNMKYFTSFAYIDEGGYGVINANDKTAVEGFHTNNISTCVGFAISNNKTQKTLFAHINPQYNDAEFLRKLLITEGFLDTNSKVCIASNEAMSSSYTTEFIVKMKNFLGEKEINKENILEINTESAAFAVSKVGQFFIPNSDRKNITKSFSTFYNNQTSELHGYYSEEYLSKQDLLPLKLDQKDKGKIELVKQFKDGNYFIDDFKTTEPKKLAFYKDGVGKKSYEMQEDLTKNSIRNLYNLVPRITGRYIKTEITKPSSSPIRKEFFMLKEESQITNSKLKNG